MKRFLKSIVLTSLVVFGAFFTSCDDGVDRPEFPQPEQISIIAYKNPNLAYLWEALYRTGLSTTLTNPGQYTVFAPTNEAFEDFLAANGYATLADVPVPALTEILLNHVVEGELFSGQLTTGYVKTLAKGAASTTNTLSMYVNTASGVRLNGVSSVVTPDIDATNGVVHIVDEVIGLPTIVTHATANSNFSTLVSALTASDNTTDFIGLLGGSGTRTVFAPTNTAFSSFLTEFSFSGLTAIPVATRDRVLKYHVVSGANVLSTSLTDNQVVQTLAGAGAANAFTINLNPARITDSSSRVSNIVATDVQCTNGIIHVVDKVLFPN